MARYSMPLAQREARIESYVETVMDRLDRDLMTVREHGLSQADYDREVSALSRLADRAYVDSTCLALLSEMAAIGTFSLAGTVQ